MPSVLDPLLRPKNSVVYKSLDQMFVRRQSMRWISSSLQRPHIDIVTLYAMVNKSIKSRTYDFRFLDKLAQDLTEPSAAHPKCALSLLSRLTSVGYFNVEICLAVCIGLLKAHHTNPLSSADRAALIGLMARQRLKAPEFLDALAGGIFPQLDASLKYKFLLDVANLSSWNPSTFPSVSTPSNALDCIRLALTFTLSPPMLSCQKSVHTTFLPALEALSLSDIRDLHSSKVQEVQLIRYALRYCYPTVYEAVSNATKAFFALACADTTIAEASTRGSPFIDSVSDCLFRLAVRHQKKCRKGPFLVDIEELGSKTIWECNSVKRFYGGGNEISKTAYYELRTSVLKGMGYNIVQVPYWHWERLRNRSARLEYSKMCRHIAFGDCRERIGAISVGETPTVFDSVGAALKTKGNEFVGENFFKKESPKRPWSWHTSDSIPVRVSL